MTQLLTQIIESGYLKNLDMLNTLNYKETNLTDIQIKYSSCVLIATYMKWITILITM